MNVLSSALTKKTEKSCVNKIMTKPPAKTVHGDFLVKRSESYLLFHLAGGWWVGVGRPTSCTAWSWIASAHLSRPAACVSTTPAFPRPPPTASAGSLGHDDSDAQQHPLLSSSRSQKKAPTTSALSYRAMHEANLEGGGGTPEQPQVALAPHNNNFNVVSRISSLPAG